MGLQFHCKQFCTRYHTSYPTFDVLLDLTQSAKPPPYKQSHRGHTAAPVLVNLMPLKYCRSIPPEDESDPGDDSWAACCTLKPRFSFEISPGKKQSSRQDKLVPENVDCASATGRENINTLPPLFLLFSCSHVSRGFSKEKSES